MMKVVMIILLMGTTAETGKPGSIATASDLFPTMELCMANRAMTRAAMKRVLDREDWLMKGGAYHIERANVLCVDIGKLQGVGT